MKSEDVTDSTACDATCDAAWNVIRLESLNATWDATWDAIWRTTHEATSEAVRIPTG